MMKVLVFISLFFATSSISYAHEYFFAFAEMDYNQSTHCFETTLEGSAHDVEDVMNEQGITIKELEDHYTDSVMLRKIEQFINKGFLLSANGKFVKSKLLGMEVKSNGLVYFYLVSESLDISKALDVQFDWLMDNLPQQQNKITVRYNGEKYTAVFLPQKRRQTINLIQ